MLGRRNGSFAVLAIVALASTPSCTGPGNGSRAVEPVYDQQTGRLQILRLDANSNGKVDTVSYMDGARILRIEIDKDEDGKVERWEYYGDDQKLQRVGFSRAGDGTADAWSYARPDGSIERVEISAARDGRISRIEHYEHDDIVSAEEDGNRDGAMDTWERYDAANGESRLASISFDTGGHGRPDRRIVYGSAGDVLVELDPDGDGTFAHP